jgi:hypothetical protein
VSGRRSSDPVLVVGCAVAALVGGVVAVAVLGSVRDIDRPALVAALVGVVVLLGVLTAALAPAAGGRAPADPPRSGAGSRAGTAAPGRRSGLAGTAPEGRGSAGPGRGSTGSGSGRGSAGTAPDGRGPGDSATGGWWTDSESDGPGSAQLVPEGGGSAGSRPAGHSAGGATPRRRTEPPEPDDEFSWADRSGNGSPEPAGGTREWWTEPRTAATPEPGPLVPALELPEHPAETRIVQCTRCGDDRVDVRHESAGGFAFDCGACGHHWSWQAGAPWPVAVVRPRLRRPAGPTTR